MAALFACFPIIHLVFGLLICRSFAVKAVRFPGTLISLTDQEIVVTNALNSRLWILLKGFTVEVIRDRGTRHELRLGYMSNKQVLSYTQDQWAQWAEFIVSRHCGNVPMEATIQTLTRLKNEAAEAERFQEASDYLKQLRELRAKGNPKFSYSSKHELPNPAEGLK
jgi:signal transduction histidine kinase